MKGYLRIIPMLLCMGMIFFLSHQPGTNFPSLFFDGEDKLAHLLVYGLLSWTVILAFSAEVRAERCLLIFAAAFVGPLLFAISDEYHQSFVAGRSPEFLDVVADAAGALIVSLVWFFKISKKQNDKKTI